MDGKPKEGIEWVPAEGVMIHVGFVKSRLESHREEVKKFLEELPNQFKKSGGGGWTFLNMCMDKDGTQWGEHRNVDELVTVGIGLGLVSFTMGREMWDALPGGLPYVRIEL